MDVAVLDIPLEPKLPPELADVRPLEPWLWGLLALAVRALFLFLPMATLDQMFIPDDTYYTLSIARSMAHGAGPCVTPGLLTSGFQPLVAFLELPVFWLFRQAVDAPVWWAVLLEILADAAVVGLLWRLCRRWQGPLAARLAAALWTLSPVAIANALGGLETSLASLLWLVVLDGYDRVLAVGGRDTRLNLLLGVSCGLALMARIDSAFLLLTLLAHSLGKSLPVRAYLWGLLALLLVIAPWWGYESSAFGSIIPESGMAVRAQIGFHKATGLAASKQVGWAMGYLATFPGRDTASFREYLGSHQSWAWSLFSLGVGGLTWAACLEWKRKATGTLYLAGLAILLFYVFYLPALWFFKRYLAPVELAVVASIATGGAAFLQARPKGFKAVGLGLISAHLLAGTVQVGDWLVHHRPLDLGYSGGKGYRAAAKVVLEALPPKARLGGLQSGALSYFAPHWAAPGVEVINLDGVVNHAAYLSIRQSRLKSYMCRQGVDHFADWRFNYEVVDKASAGDPQGWDVHSLAVGPPQGVRGLDRFLLSRVTWPVQKAP